jgi:hypothetical protein
MAAPPSPTVPSFTPPAIPWRQGLRIGLEAAYPEEDWGFTAQQAAKKLLKAWLALADQRPPRLHNLMELAILAE